MSHLLDGLEQDLDSIPHSITDQGQQETSEEPVMKP